MRTFALGIALAAAANVASAADLASMRQTFVEQYSESFDHNWSGIYVGGFAGGAFGRSNWEALSTFDVSGGTVGGLAGYNYQRAQWVFGLEGDFGFARLSGTTTVNCPIGCQTNTHWLSTVRGRVGYSVSSNWLPYLTGGLAVGDITTAVSGFPGARSGEYTAVTAEIERRRNIVATDRLHP